MSLKQRKACSAKIGKILVGVLNCQRLGLKLFHLTDIIAVVFLKKSSLGVLLEIQPLGHCFPGHNYNKLV